MIVLYFISVAIDSIDRHLLRILSPSPRRCQIPPEFDLMTRPPLAQKTEYEPHGCFWNASYPEQTPERVHGVVQGGAQFGEVRPLQVPGFFSCLRSDWHLAPFAPIEILLSLW